jgi:hypothetical protein
VIGRRRTAALACVVLSIAGALGFAAPASADPRVGLSLDGVTWVEDLTTPLLDPDFVWVPGESQVATLYFRNQSGQRADGHAEVIVGPEDAILAAALDVRIRYDGGGWTGGSTGPTIPLADGQVVRLDIEVAFDPSAGNATMLREVPLDVRVLLSGEDPVGSPTTTTTTTPTTTTPPGQSPPTTPALPDGTPSAPPGGTPAAPADRSPSGPADGAAGRPADGRSEGDLARTGIEVLRLLAAAGALVVAGAWLVTRRREGPDG